jgi:hypothetical protein
MPSKATVAEPPPPQRRAGDDREAVVLFLGAGASKAFGYPLTGDLLPQLVSHLEDGTLTKSGMTAADQEVLRRGLRELLPGIDACPPKELPLITDVLTLVDHGMHAGTTILRGWPNREVLRFRSLVDQTIADMMGPDGASETPELKRVADWVLRTRNTHRLGIITTNYDIELELELFDRVGLEEVATRFDFGMSWRDPALDQIHARPGEGALPFYKLHGSLNWLRCPMCEYIFVNVLGVIVHLAAAEARSDFNTCHCGHWPLHSVMVTPSYVRDTRDVNLVGIWRNALDLMASADRWIVAGYSLPAEDIAIRALLLKAYRIRKASARARPLVISIVQKGTTARRAYQLLFPDAAFHSDGIETFDLSASLT